MTTERISGLALMHVHKDTELDAEHIIHRLADQKNTHLALLFRPEWRRGSNNNYSHCNIDFSTDF